MIENIKKIGILALMFNPLFGIGQSIEEECKHEHHFSDAPIGVMGDHLHHKGDWMISYRYMNMGMDGLIQENQGAEGNKMYMVNPNTMNMQMHMFGAMYAPSDKVTLMIMSNYQSNTMSLTATMMMENGMGMEMPMNQDFSTSSSGFGDMNVQALIKLFNKGKYDGHANIGVRIPTGSIEERGNTPMMEDAILGYPMQLGSGTTDPYAGGTFMRHGDRFSLGLQAIYTYRVGENARDYSLGNKLNSTIWGTLNLAEHFHVTGRLDYRNEDSINGKDIEMNAMMMPLLNADNSGGTQMDGLIGACYHTNFAGYGLRVGIEGGIPLVQNPIGTQMNNEYRVQTGIQFSF